MHLSPLTPPEERVLGCLLEKRFTTPDQYPLTLNALRLACNQSTNREPVTAYDEPTVRDAAQRLCKYGVVRLASGHQSRATKYRHLAEEALGLGREDLAVLAILLLRGPQTLGELKSRTERMVTLDSLEHVELVLGSLGERGYAARLERRPGQKEDRFAQLLGDAVDVESAAYATPVAADVVAVRAEPIRTSTGPSPIGRIEALERAVDRIDALERRVGTLERKLAELGDELGVTARDGADDPDG